MRWEYVAGIITAISLLVTPIVIEIVKSRMASRKTIGDSPAPLPIVQGQTVDFQAETMAAWKTIAADRQHTSDSLERDLRKANALILAKDAQLAELREDLATRELTVTVLQRELAAWRSKYPPPT